MGRNAELPSELARLRVDPAREQQPDDHGCDVLHVDMDAFFAAVEILRRPELATEPVVVAGAGPRSVVLSANYPARRFGVHSAMPVAAARRLCPHAEYIAPTRDSYTEVSASVMEIFRAVTPLVEPLSLDEAFLDVSGALRRLGSTPAAIGADIRERVAAKHGITCSVGVAPVKFAAKLASGMAKPDGMLVVPGADLLRFLHPLPVSALSGVGTRTAQHCARLGIHTIGDVARTPSERLRRALGEAAGVRLHALANGHDDSAVVPERADKSLGSEQTFDTDLYDVEGLRRVLLLLAQRTAYSLRVKGLRARTVSIKVRFADFRTITRARTLGEPTDVAKELYDIAAALLEEHLGGAGVRLIGVRAEGLVSEAEPEQLSFDTNEPRWRDAEVAADGVRSRFGSAAVRPAALLPQESSADG